MKILITGGTGFLGTCLTKKLLREGHKVTVYSRRTSENPKKIGAEQITADTNNKNRLNQALKSIDTVYHLAANLDESNPKMYKQNIETTKNVISACKKTK